MEQLNGCFGARSRLTADSVRALGLAMARREPAAFAPWCDVASRLYGKALGSLDSHMGRVLARSCATAPPLPPDRLLFALQTYYAMVVRCVAEDLCGKGPAKALEEPVFSWAGSNAEPEAAVVSEQIAAAVASCRFNADSNRAVLQGDLFKRLYQSVFPRALRHALGEYYTPDWLADHVLRQAGWPDSGRARLLDPSCGSGTFLVAAIRELRRHAGDGLPPEEQLANVLRRVTGFDLNPLAVLTARANYLVAVRDLLPDDRILQLPVACCDTICDGPADIGPGGADPYDLLVGNPPWIAWDNLPNSYRLATQPLWQRYGLFSLDGNAGRYGGAKKDLAMLLLYVALDRYLRDGGRAAMVISQTLLHTKGAGDGFRRFRLGPEGDPLAVLQVDDLSRLQPFPEAATSAAVLLLEKGLPTVYPVPYMRWLPDKNGSRRDGSASVRVEHLAEPIDPNRPGTPWFVRPRGLRTSLRELVGPSDYTARLGANSAGANGVYWVELLGPAPGGVRIRNRAEAGRHRVEPVEHVVEPDLIFPLLRWGDVARFRAQASGHILLPQDPGTRAGLTVEWMRARVPRTLEYFERFEPLLRRRAAYRRYQEDQPFYSIYNVGRYTLAGVKVVWRRMDMRVTAAVVEPVDDPLLGCRPLIPQETCVLVDVATADEAHYLCALLNSAVVGFLVGAHSVAGGKGFGSPGVLEFLRLRRFDAHCELHRRLTAASRAAHAAACTASQDGGRPAVSDIQREIDFAAAELWGLDASEQEAIATALAGG